MEARGYLQAMTVLNSKKEYLVFVDMRLSGPRFRSGNSRPEHIRAHHELNPDPTVVKSTA
jgi:hypothetical protein